MHYFIPFGFAVVFHCANVLCLTSLHCMCCGLFCVACLAYYVVLLIKNYVINVSAKFHCHLGKLN